MILNIAHRGFSAEYPENTLLSFEKALELGVTWLELDLQVTSDEHLVVMHDGRVDRTTDGSGLVSEKTLEEVLLLDAGIWRGDAFKETRVPTFDQVLEAFGSRAMIVVELKFESQEAIPAVLDAIASTGQRDRIVISSFDLPKLPIVKALAPDAAITALLKANGRSPEELIETTLGLGADTIAPRCNEIDVTLVDHAHQAGLLVRAWGLGRDQGQEMTRLIDLGVDGMTTDCPDILQRILLDRNLV
jgi:glycerophosphoryl diester phosphodiesterase